MIRHRVVVSENDNPSLLAVIHVAWAMGPVVAVDIDRTNCSNKRKACWNFEYL